MPFEAVMECYPQQNKLPSILHRIFKKEAFNSFHESFCQKLRQGIFNSIIIPNYDLAFDKKLATLNFTNCIYRYDQYKSKNIAGFESLFKIHGTAENNSEGTLIFTLSQEKNLETWKVEFLTELIKDRILIIIGYSGRDFDICPVIKELGYDKILWVERNTDSLTAYQKELIKAKSTNEIFNGDFSRFLKKFFNEDIFLQPSSDPFIPEQYFILNTKERLKWQIDVLDRMACATFMRFPLKELKGKISEGEWVKYQCSLYGHTGEYKKASKEHINLAQCFQENSKEHINALIGTSGSLLAYQNFFSAYKYYKKAKALTKKYFPNDNERLLVLLTTEIVFWSKIQQIFPPFRRRILKKLRKLQSIVDNLRDNASLDERQIIQLNLERLGFTTTFSMLSGYKGYNSLGLAGMALIAYRHKIENNRWEQDEIPLADLVACIKRCELLGMCTELWKQCRIRFKKCKLTSVERGKVWRSWKRNLQVSQYSFPRFILERIDLYWNFFKI